MADTATKPIVWALCTGRFGGDDEAWAAYSNDGQKITSHVSSNRSWGTVDVGPKVKAAAYEKVIGTSNPDEIDYRVVPEGEDLPDDVVERGIANGYLKRISDDDEETV